MKMLYVVPYLPGDIQDDNHFRVEHHHSLGLSGTTCILSGGREREVRCTSRKALNWEMHKCETILVHLKPLPKSVILKYQLKNLDTLDILKWLSKYPSSLDELRKQIPLKPYGQEPNPFCSIIGPSKLMHKKLTKLWNQDLICFRTKHGRILYELTNKGRYTLSQLLEVK